MISAQLTPAHDSFAAFDEALTQLVQQGAELERAARIPVDFLFTLREILRRQPARETFTRVCNLV